jgi:hypothetical protein
MMLMPSNNSSGIVHYLAAKHPGKIGWLFGPSNYKRPRFYLPFALDNDAFAAWTNNTPWNYEAWNGMLERINSQPIKPLWALVPDVVADKQKTLELWNQYDWEVEVLGWKKAFAVQDGMTPSDVPKDADVVFVGGTTAWKWEWFDVFTLHFPRVHVGRVNTLRQLWLCDDAGVESVDGTGWFRTGHDGDRVDGIMKWLAGIRE